MSSDTAQPLDFTGVKGILPYSASADITTPPKYCTTLSWLLSMAARELIASVSRIAARSSSAPHQLLYCTFSENNLLCLESFLKSFYTRGLHEVVLALQHCHQEANSICLNNCSSNFTCTGSATSYQTMLEEDTIFRYFRQCFCARNLYFSMRTREHRREQADGSCLKHCHPKFT